VTALLLLTHVGRPSSRRPTRRLHICIVDSEKAGIGSLSSPSLRRLSRPLASYERSGSRDTRSQALEYDNRLLETGFARAVDLPSYYSSKNATKDPKDPRLNDDHPLALAKDEKQREK
jgi:hypothetical protein